MAIRTGLRRGWRRGLLEGNQTWIVLGGVALIGHLAQRALANEEDIVFHEQLDPGESFRITHLPKG